MAKNSASPLKGDYQETVCLVRCDLILQKDHSDLRNDFFEYCSRRDVLPMFDFRSKQLHLSGLSTARIEAGRETGRSLFHSLSFAREAISGNRERTPGPDQQPAEHSGYSLVVRGVGWKVANV